MSRKLWGEFFEEPKPIDDAKFVHSYAKRSKIEEVESLTPVAKDKHVTVKIKNPLVTQTIEVMKQTEMLQSLIDTYSNKSGTSTYLLNPCQMIPEVDFPPENVADFVSDDKFVKPIWFVPPLNTPFSRGVPQNYPKINSHVCRAALRKAVSGQLCVSGFTDAAESALILFADAAEEFMRSLLNQIRDVHANDPELEKHREVQVKSVEKAYYTMTNKSLTQVHNYFKHNLVARNRAEIAEFKEALQEYDKLMKESQSMQKDEFEGADAAIQEVAATAPTETATSQGNGDSALQNAPGSTTLTTGHPHMSAENTR